MTHAKNIFTYMLALFSTLALTGCFEDSNDDCQGQAESSIGMAAGAEVFICA